MIALLSLAYALDRPETAETLGMGSTTVANPFAQAGVTTNPGVIGVARRYTFSAAFGYADRGLRWNAGAVDTVTSPIAFGLTYSGDRSNPPLTEAELPGWQVPGQVIPNRKRTHDLGFALAAPFADRKLAIGLGGSVSFFSHDRQGKGTTGNMTAGVAYRPVEAVTLGVTGRNLLPISDAAGERPLEILGGVYVGEKGVAAVALDGGVDLDAEAPLLLAVGVEAFPTQQAAFRAGWRLEDRVNHIALGAGAGTPDASVDLGLQVPTPSLIKPADWTVQLSLRFKGPEPDAIRPDR